MENNKPTNVFTVINIVVKMKEGNLTEIVWDNQCYDCKDNCKEGIVSKYVDSQGVEKTMTYENCFENDICNKNKTLCDPKFYITWFGTDKDGKQLKSANLAMSKFQNYAISELFNSVKYMFGGNEDD